MSDIPISSLPITISLIGNELVPLVQAGTTKRTTTAAIAALASVNPGGTASFVFATDESAFFPGGRTLAAETNVLSLTDDGAGQSLIVGIEDHGVTNAKLALVADQTLKGNIAGLPASPADITISQVWGAAASPLNVIAAGAYSVPATALSIVVNKTDGANVVLPALAVKVGPVRIVGAQATAHPFNVTCADGTIMGSLSSYAFTSDYQSVTFYPAPSLSTWTA